MLTFGELFAGIGGFSLGLERAGMTCKWQVEIDPYATAVLKKHWPDVPKHDDVRTFPPTHTHTQDFSVDLICGGFPCQDISVAGKGAGLAGERSGLWHDFARIIRTVRPRWLVIENVPALTARGLGTVLGDLAEIGFDAEWHCIPACAVGAPHRRERIWIVAYASGQQRACGDIAPENVEQDICGAAQLCDRQRQAVGSLDAVANAIGKPDAMRRDGTPCSQGVAGRFGDAGGGERDRGPRCAGQAGQSPCDVADAEGVSGRSRLRKDDGTRQPQAGRWPEPCDYGCDVPDSDRAGRQQQRRREPVPAEQPAAECGGWWSVEPDVGRVAHGVPSRVDRLRCLGNAVVPQVVEVIGRAIIAHEERNRTANGMTP